MSVFALLERLAPHIEKEVNLVINSKQEAETLSSKLRKIQVGLQDAERKGVTDDNIKEWLKQLEDVTYEMDDVLDEWQTANLQVQVEGADQDSSDDLWEKVRSILLSLCLCFKHAVGRREITKKIKALSDRIDNILKERGNYTFVPSENDRSQEFKQQPTTSLVNERKVYGRDLDKNRLVEKLVTEEQENSDYTQIISIVGIGGVGKTTLAQLAYNDPQVDALFAKGWVSVSEPFNALAIFRAVLEVFGESFANVKTLETLVQRTKKAVQDKRFLLVLDNVWTEDRNKWEDLKNCLHGAKGSRILVTTRSESVARMMGTAHVLKLGLLLNSDCETILNGIALEGRTGEECEKLREIGIKIAEKCDGLPLAARSVGSTLALRSTEPEWRALVESPLWKYGDVESDLFRLLNLSYIDLSPLLKRCFLSSVVFPRGALISIDKIIRIWMAYGYLNGSLDKVQPKGLEYFNNLAMRSFFQKLKSDEDDGDVISYKMHDIMHKFANYLSGSEYGFIMDGGLQREKRLPSPGATYNLPSNSLGRLRTFCARYVTQKELPLGILSHLTSVRVLSMCSCNLQELPQEVGKLFHLRYLDISDNPMRELPETVSDLYNLQTLGLDECINLRSLPQGIGKLVNLRHLLNRDTYKLVQIPQGLEKLTGLWTLSEFRGSKLGYLKNMNQLQGPLFLSLKQLNESGLAEVCKANLRNKKCIQKLTLEFGKEENIVDIVEALQPPPNLRNLVILSETGKWLSRWMDTSFSNLEVLEFDGQEKCSNLPPFGKLPALERLVVSRCRFKCLSVEFLGLGGVIEDANVVSKTQSAVLSSPKWVGGFPRLKRLLFEYCWAWEKWEDIKEEAQDDSIGIMASLKELEFRRCPRLEALPHTLLRQATSLKIRTLSDSQRLHARYNKVSGYDQHNIPHIQIVERARARAEYQQLREKIRLSQITYKAALRYINEQPLTH